VVCIGYAKSEVSFETKYFVSKELDIRGSRNALPEDFRAVIEYVRRNNLPEAFVSGIYPPEKAGEALQYWSGNAGKVFRIFIEF
jgi:threonine dehydrogenase-like Zn-dependent dehydrogenase